MSGLAYAQLSRGVLVNTWLLLFCGMVVGLLVWLLLLRNLVGFSFVRVRPDANESCPSLKCRLWAQAFDRVL